MPILEVLSWLYTSCSFAVLVSHLTGENPEAFAFGPFGSSCPGC